MVTNVSTVNHVMAKFSGPLINHADHFDLKFPPKRQICALFAMFAWRPEFGNFAITWLCSILLKKTVYLDGDQASGGTSSSPQQFH